MAKKVMSTAELLHEIDARYSRDPEVLGGGRKAVLPVAVQQLGRRNERGANWHAVWAEPAIFDEVLARVISELQDEVDLHQPWLGSTARRF